MTQIPLRRTSHDFDPLYHAPDVMTFVTPMPVMRSCAGTEGGEDVQAKLPILATYMGHVSIVSTQYYLHLIEPVAAAATCSLKYSMKAGLLKAGASRGAPPAFFSVLLFWFLELPPVFAPAYTVVLIALCWLPVRYPITSLMTTHWKFGFESAINYLSFAAMAPALIWLQGAPAILFWPILALMLFHLFVAPVLLQVGIVRAGFRRVF